MGKKVTKIRVRTEKQKDLRRKAAKRRYHKNLKKNREKHRAWAAKNYCKNAKKLRERVGIFARTIKGRYTRLKAAAKVRGLELRISFEEYQRLVSGSTCEYCSNSLPETGGGLDRVNWKTGYTLENVVPCCKSCNDKKGSLERIGFSIPRIRELLRELNER